MTILILGVSGHLSIVLQKLLDQFSLPYRTISLDSSFNISSRSQLYAYLNSLHFNFVEPLVVVNTLAALRPITRSDEYINIHLSSDLLFYPPFANVYLIHLSTINVRLSSLLDRYTNQKRTAECLITSSHDKCWSIVRLPLLLPQSDEYTRVTPSQFKPILRFSSFLPGFLLILPSRNVYKPISFHQAALDLIHMCQKAADKNHSITELSGTEKYTLTHIVEELTRPSINSKSTSSRLLTVPFPFTILDFFLSRVAFIRTIFCSSVYLQQLLSLQRF